MIKSKSLGQIYPIVFMIYLWIFYGKKFFNNYYADNKLNYIATIMYLIIIIFQFVETRRIMNLIFTNNFEYLIDPLLYFIIASIITCYELSNNLIITSFGLTIFSVIYFVSSVTNTNNVFLDKQLYYLILSLSFAPVAIFYQNYLIGFISFTLLSTFINSFINKYFKSNNMQNILSLIFDYIVNISDYILIILIFELINYLNPKIAKPFIFGKYILGFISLLFSLIEKGFKNQSTYIEEFYRIVFIITCSIILLFGYILNDKHILIISFLFVISYINLRIYELLYKISQIGIIILFFEILTIIFFLKVNYF